MASVDNGPHVALERNDELDIVFCNGKEHFAVEETPIDDQRTDRALGADIVFGLLQHRQDMQIVRLFDGVDLNGQRDAGIELINGPDLPAINRHLDGLEFTVFSVTPGLDLAFPGYGATALELFGGLKVCGVASRMDVLGKDIGLGQLLNTTIEEVFYGPGRDFDHLVGQCVDANGSPDFRRRRGAKFSPPCATAVSDLIAVETADSHEELIGEKELMYGLHLGNGADDFHQKNQDELNEGNQLSLLVLGGDALQKREDLNLAQILKEEVEEGGLIEREDRVHFPSTEKVICHPGIVSLRGMPEEPLQDRLLHLLSSEHVETPSQRKGSEG